MGQRKGQTGNPNGRPAGTQNKVTTSAKEAILSFINENSDRVREWVEEIYREDGAKAALASYIDLLEFVVPKLARTELAGDKNAPVQITVTKFGDSQDDYRNLLLQRLAISDKTDDEISPSKGN